MAFLAISNPITHMKPMKSPLGFGTADGAAAGDCHAAVFGHLQLGDRKGWIDGSWHRYGAINGEK